MSNTKKMWIRILCLTFVLFSLFALNSCDETDANVECEHTWSDWSVITEASCEEEGERQRSCSECDETEKEAIAALSHDFGEWSVTKAASCTEEGEETRVCSRDSEHSETRKIAKTAHTFDVEKEDVAYLKKEGSCTEKAVYYKSCKCGAKGTETFESGTPAHTYDKEVVDAKYLKSGATCTAKAVYYKSCECGAFDAEKSETFENGTTVPHTYDKSVASADYLKTEATCTAKAVYYKSCECGAFDALKSETFEGGSLAAHVYDRAVVDAKYLKSEANCQSGAVYYKSCKCGAFDTAVCGTFENGEKTPHVYDREVAESKFVKTPATCTEAAVYYKSCACGEKGTETFESGKPVPHTYDRRVVDAKYLKSEATCTEKAVYYKSCKCGYVDITVSETFRSGDTLPHIYDREVVADKYLKSAATCTAKAVYYKSCVCGEKGSATFEYGELTACVYDREIADITYLKSAATCTAKAVYYKSCVCGRFDTALSATFEYGETVPHTYDREVVADKYLKSEATCTKAAVYYKSCECGAFDIYDSDTFESGNPIAHIYNKEVVGDKYLASEATCTDTATYYKSCECGAFDSELSATFAYGNPIAHTYDKEVVDPKYFAKAATCETRALYYKSCECGAHDNALSETFEYGELTGHNYKQIGFTAATCTVNGLKTEECGVCGDILETPIISEGHNYEDTVVDPKCLVDGYTEHKCSKCGDTYTDTIVGATGHLEFNDTVISATCEEDGYTQHKCKNCGYTEKINPTTKRGHDYVYTPIDEATCKNTGTDKVTCSRCGYENIESTPMKPHNHVPTVTPATCTVNGYTTYTCDGCGDSYTEAGETAQGHKWSTSVISPTCTEQGYTLYDCDNCDAEEKHDWVDADGHSFSDATCAEPEKCGVCGTTGAAATGEHRYSGVQTFAPTCTEKGTMTYTCETCGDSYTEDISATGHNTEGDDGWTETKKAVEGKNCTFVTVKTKTCLNDNCGHIVTVTSAEYSEHNYQATITQAATCTVPGIKTYACTVCGEQPAENATVEYSEASGHTWVETASTATTKSYECSACHETKTVVHSDSNSANVGAGDLSASGGVNLGGTEIELDDETKAQLGQITETDDITVSVNKIEGADRNDLVNDADQLEYIGDAPIYDLTMLIGGDENNKISNFNGKVTVRIPYTLEAGEDPENLTIWYIDDEGNVSTIDGATYVVIGGQGYAVFETDHFSYYTVTKLTPAERCERDGKHIEKIIIQEANCLVGGYKMVVCTRCGEIISNETTPALGHKWNDKVISDATCDAAGRVEHSCESCKLVYYTATAALGHKWTETKTVEATCSEAGYVLYVCENNKEHTHTVVIPKSNHSYAKTLIDPTCTAEGYTKHTCSDCGASYVTDIVKATGHIIVKKDVAPTCISEGYTEQFCDNCGQRFENINIVPVSGHKWNIEAPTCDKGQTCTICNAAGAPATGEHNMTEKGECSECGKACEHSFYEGETHAPTCVENGYTEYVCSFCKMVEHRDIVEKGEHNWKEAEHKAPTCTDDGYDKWICSVCGETKTEVLPKGDGLHKEATKVVAPTCNEEGYTLHYCRTCGAELERTDIVEATGHSYEVFEKVDATCDKDGYITLKCEGCGDEATKVLEATGHSHELFETIAPTCDKAGAEIYKCAACGDSYEKEIPATGHKHELLETIAPTCDKAGAEIYKCTACGDSYEKEIPATGHRFELSETIDSTCEVNGKKIYKCTACDATREEELELADHKYADGKCEVCGKEQSQCVHVDPEDFVVSYKFINENAHSCNDGVEVRYTCPNCEQVIVSEIIDGHIYEHRDFSELGVAGNIWVRSCVICNYGDINIELYNCKFEMTEREYVDDEGYMHYAESGVCVDCGFTISYDVRLIIDGCCEIYEYTYVFGSEEWGAQETVVVMNFVESHKRTTEWEESVDEENLVFTQIGITSCSVCGKVFGRETEIMRYLTEDVPLDYTAIIEISIDDKGTEFVIVEKEYERAGYEINADGEYVMVEMEEVYTVYDGNGNPSSVEESLEIRTVEGESKYFYAAFSYYINGEKQLMGYEEEKYTTITLPGGYEVTVIESNVSGEYDINGELIDGYSETYTYEIIEGKSCQLKVTCTDSEGNTETYIKEVHAHIEQTHEFATSVESCTQGLYIIEKCTVCGEEIERSYRTYHSTITTEEDRIDASELGCACGGSISVARCQYCDYETVYYHFNCKFAAQDAPSYGDGEVVIKPSVPDVDFGYDTEDNWGEVIGGNTKPSTSTTGGTCQICGFTYSVETTTEVGENCQLIKRIVYSFGKDADGNPIKVIEIVDNGTYRHSYTSESNIVSETEEIQADGSVLIVTVRENKTYCVTCGHFETRTVSTTKTDVEGWILYEEIETDSNEKNYHEKIVRTYEKYTTPDGDIATRILSCDEYRYNADGEVTFFMKETYEYNPDNPCVVIVVREYSDGEIERYVEESHGFHRKPVLVEGAESCEEGVRIIDVCIVCGTEVDEGDVLYHHYTVDEYIDLSLYGSTCGAWMNLSYCACGQNSNAYFNRAGYFKPYHTSYTDENGNNHSVERGECMVDGFWYEIDRYNVKGENCMLTEYTVYRFGNSMSTGALLEKSIVAEREAHLYEFKELMNETYQETDETGATLNVHVYEETHVCTACGYVSDHYRNTIKTDILGNTVYELNEHFTTSADGVEYIQNSDEVEYQVVELTNGKTASVVMSETTTDYDENGNMTWFRTERYEYHDGYCRYTVYVTGSDGYEKVEGGENHRETTQQLTLLEGATSCEQGVNVAEVCVFCGIEIYSNIYYYHHTVSEWTDLSQYGCKCGGELYTNYCACGYQAYVSVNSGCSFESTGSNVVDAAGNKRSVIIYTCVNCGFSYSRETWTETDALCHSYYYAAYNIGLDAEGNAAFTQISVKGRGTNHKTVSDTGEAVESKETDENGNLLTVYTTEEKTYCTVCGTVVNHFIMVEKFDSDGNLVYRSETYYSSADGVEYISSFSESVYMTVTLANGSTKQLLVKESGYKYESDGSVLDFAVFEYAYAEGDYCIVTVTRTDYYGTETYTEERHGETKMDAALMDGATSCYDGVIVTYTCVECGKVSHTEEHYSHIRSEEWIDLNEYGCGCGSQLYIMYCACGYYDSLDLHSNCVGEYTENVKGEQNGYYQAWRCNNCGFNYTRKSWTEADENCNAIQYTEWRFFDKVGELTLEKLIEKNLGVSHSYKSEVNITETEETDESGRKLSVVTREATSYCQNCKVMDLRTVLINKFDQNGDLVCSEENVYTYADGLEFLEEKNVSTYNTLIKPDGSSFRYEATREVYNYLSGKEDHRLYEYSYEEGNYCVKYVKVTYYSSGKVDEYTEGEHGEIITSVELMDGATSCEQGVKIREICANCGAEFNSYEEYYHRAMTEKLDLSKLGGCEGGVVLINRCACGSKTNINVMGCLFMKTGSEEVEQEDGTAHTIVNYLCESCGFTYTYEYWTEYGDSCENYQYRIYRFGLDENGEPLVVRELTINRGQSHGVLEAKSESVESTEKDEAGNELRVVTTTTTVTCERCGKFSDMRVIVEKYLVVDAESGQEICVYISNEYYGISTEVENGVYLSNTRTEEYGYCFDSNGRLDTYRLLEYTEYYDTKGNVIDFERYEYSYEEGNYCKSTVTYTNFYGEKREETRENHRSTYYTYVLSEGSETCEDGIDYVELCRECGSEIYRHTNYSTEHHFGNAPSSTMALDEYGCVCGGMLQIYTCPCGLKERAEVVSDCPFEYTGEYYEYKAEDGNTHTREIITCPVTDPTLCGFSYVYIDWESSDENCMGVNHLVILLGLDAKTGEYAYKYEKSYGTGYYNHNLIHEENNYTTEDGKSVSEITNTCTVCGFVSYANTSTEYIDENGDRVIERDESYYSGNAEITKLISRRYTVTVMRTVKLNNGGTRDVVVLDRTERYSGEKLSSWKELSYSYTDELCCSGTMTDTEYYDWYEAPITNEYVIDNHSISRVEVIEKNTCTQRGIDLYGCEYCGYSYESETPAIGHMYRHDYTTNMWVCRECGLENFTGADGEVIFEDLTSRRGDGTQYVVGYINHMGSKYIFSLYLVVGEEEIPLELEAVDDGKSLVYIDAAAVLELAKAMGYEPCAYMVCLRFVPLDGKDYYDFAITLDPHVYVVDEENSVNPDDPCLEETVTAYKCVFCSDSYTESVLFGHDTEWISHSIGDCGSAINTEVCKVCQRTVTIERFEACPYEVTHNSVADENGVIHNIATYVCPTCGAAYQNEYYTVSKENCLADSYDITRWGLQDDGSYAFAVVMSEEMENHNMTSDRVSTEDGLVTTTVNTTKCETCGMVSHKHTSIIERDENENIIASSTETINADGSGIRNNSEYFFAEDGNSRYESVRVYEHFDGDGTIINGYTIVYEYDFEAGIRTWTRTYTDGRVTTGEEPIKMA